MSATNDTGGSDGLGDELFQIRQNTLEEGRARGKITAVDSTDETITVHYTVLTTGEELENSYAKPQTWTSADPFVRLVEWCGYNSASAMQLEGERIPLRQDPDSDDWEIDIDRMPGEAILDRADYYHGLVVGALSMVVVGVAAWVPAAIGVSSPVGPPWILQAGFAVGALVVILPQIRAEPTDNRRTLSHDELDVSNPPEVLFDD